MITEEHAEMDAETTSKKIISSCQTRWGMVNHDKRTEYFRDNLSTFLKQFDKEAEEIIEILLGMFWYYSHEKTNSCLTALHQRIVNEPYFDIEDSIFCVLKTENGKINSSTEYLCEYRLINRVNTYSVITNIDDLDEDAWNNIRTIVFIDDYCGSGDTFFTFLNARKEKFKQKNIIYAVIHIMSDTLNVIDKFAKQNPEISIKVINCDESAKAFACEMLLERREVFAEISDALGITNEENGIWGFKRTEALIAYHNNTPNNTLGIFWKDTDRNKALFPRRKENKPNWLKSARKDKQARNKANYSRKVKSISDG